MDVTYHSEATLIKKLREVTLRNSDIKPYKDSRIDIVTVNPANLAPVQRYVLKSELRKIEQVRWNILENFNIDILKLTGYLSCDYGDQVIDVLPVVVEEYFTEFGDLRLLINDGAHRSYLAYQMGTPLNIVYVRGIPKETPYYSYALPTGFDKIDILDSIPEGYIKKFHVAKNHKNLYRLFNSSFSNVGDSRPYMKEKK